MVDIHSHVLPGVDDGARTLEDSVAMLQIAAEAGTTGIVATSHANTEYTWDPDVVEAKVAELQAAVGNSIRVYSGCELHLTFDNINDAVAHPTKYTINHRQWLLIEFSDLIIFQNSSEILGRLRQAGMLPIIAHPERNQILQNRFEALEQWVDEGAFLQVTALSVLGTFGSAARKFSERLIEKGLVHFIASDAHDTSYRTPKLSDAFQWLKARYGEEYATLVTTVNPQATVDGDYLEHSMAPKRRKWFGLWAS
jgi:protein-tyrosine phosphatase